MSILSLRQLRDKLTRDQQLNAALEFLSGLGFRTTSWQPGSVQRAIITAVSWLTADAASIATVIAENALDTEAEGDWLDVISRFYGHVREQATAAEGEVVLALAVGSPPASWSADEIIISPSADLTQPLYRVTEAGSLTAGNSASYTVQAIETGTKANIDSTSDLYFVTPIAGLSAEFVDDPTTGTWLTSPGTDRESDARLRERNRLAWSQLSYGANRDAYALWALEADSSVTRTNVTADGSGGVTIYCATPEGAISAGQETDIQAYIDARAPFGDTPDVAQPSVLPVTVTLAPTIEQGTSTVEDIRNAIDEYFGEVPIGGVIVPPSSTGQILREEIVERIMRLPGVKRAGLTAPASDVAVASNQIPSATITVTPLIVAS